VTGRRSNRLNYAPACDKRQALPMPWRGAAWSV